METKLRTAIKALTWQALGLVTMTLVGLIFTGSAFQSVALATVSAVSGYLCYFLHERLWSRIPWGIRRLAEPGRHERTGAETP